MENNPTLKGFHPTKSKYNDKAKPTSQAPTPDHSFTRNPFGGGDPYSESKPFSKRQRFNSATSSHKSVTKPPSTQNAPPRLRSSLPISRPIFRSLSSERSQGPLSLPTSRPRTAPVEPDSALPRFRSTIPAPRTRLTLIAHPNQHVSPSPPRAPGNTTPANGPSASQQQKQPRPVQKRYRVPAVPCKPTMQQGDEEGVTHDARQPSDNEAAPDVVDLDDDTPAVTRPSVQKRSQTERDAAAPNPAKSDKTSMLRSKPVAAVLGESANVTRTIRVPSLKSCEKGATIGGGARGGGGARVVESQGDTMPGSADDGEGEGRVGGRQSVGARFREPITYDEEEAKESMLRCLREKRSVIRLSFLGMSDIQFDNLLRLYEPSPEDIEINRTLILNNNKLSKFSQFRREKTEHLNVRYLDLSRNQLRIVVELSEQIRVLNLSRNFLRELPLMHSLFELEALDLSHNELESLPPGLCNLKRLEILDLGGNQLTCLPEDCFGEGSSLKSLLLANNPDLAELPLCAEHLEKLEELSLKGTIIQNRLMRTDLRLNAVGLISLLAGKRADTLVERKANSVRGRNLRNVEKDEVQAVT